MHFRKGIYVQHLTVNAASNPGRVVLRTLLLFFAFSYSKILGIFGLCPWNPDIGCSAIARHIFGLCQYYQVEAVLPFYFWILPIKIFS
jgi:hypothetical protein